MRTIISKMPRRTNFLHGKHATDIGYPWITYGAIMALERIVTPDFNILEVGSGGSTIFFSERCKTIKSLENRQEWVNRVRVRLPEPSNATLICGSMKELLEIVKAEPPDYYDLVMVDTNPKDGVIYEEVSRKVRKKGYLVLDNYGVPEYSKFNYKGWDVYNFDDFDFLGRGTRISIKL